MSALADPSRITTVTLACLEVDWVNIANSLIGRVVNFNAPSGGASRLELIAPTNRAAAALVRIKWGGHLFEVRVSQPAVVPALDIAIRHDLPLSIWLLAVKEAVRDWIGLMSEVSGTPAVVVELVRDPVAAPLNLSLGLQLSQAGRANRGTIEITAADAAGWRWIASRLSGFAPALPAAIDPVMILSFRLRSVCVPISELRTLQLGDVVLLDESRVETNQLPLTCVSGERFVYGLNAISDGIAIRLSNEPLKELIVEHEPTVNPRPTRTSPKAGDAATPEIPQGPDALDALDMWLQFEVGHARMSLGQIRALTPGQVLVAAGDDSTHEVRVLCNSRWIATGRLVAIGERLGVQVTSLGGVDMALGAEKDQRSQVPNGDNVPEISKESGLQSEEAAPKEPTADSPQPVGEPADQPDRQTAESLRLSDVSSN